MWDLLWIEKVKVLSCFVELWQLCCIVMNYGNLVILLWIVTAKAYHVELWQLCYIVMNYGNLVILRWIVTAKAYYVELLQQWCQIWGNNLIKTDQRWELNCDHLSQLKIILPRAAFQSMRKSPLPHQGNRFKYIVRFNSLEWGLKDKERKLAGCTLTHSLTN